MPNWCFSTVLIHGKPKQLKSLETALEEATSKNFVENGFGKNWLGNLVEYMGMRYGEMPCRGTVEWVSLSDDEDVLEINVASAWSPHLKPIEAMVEKYAPDSEMLYVAEEPGCCLYWTNDPEYIDQYVVDKWEDDSNLPLELYNMDSYTYFSDDELRSFLRDVLNKPNAELKELLEVVDEEYGDYLSINQYECVELDEI